MKRILTIILTLFIFVGCFKENEKTDNKIINLTLATWGSSPEETKMIEKQLELFHEKYPNIKVTKQVVIGDYNQVLQSDIAARMEADVFYLDSIVSSIYMTKEAIYPLDEFLTSEDKEDINQNVLSGFQYNGKVYGIPKDYNPLVMIYNTEMLKKAEVEVPRTWEELILAMEKIDKAGKAGLLGENYSVPMSISNGGERIAPFILQNGGDVFNNEENKETFTEKPAIEAVEYYMDIIKRGYAKDPKSLGEAWNGDSFAREKVAMVIEGGWIIPYLATAAPELEYQIEKLPKGKKEGTMLFTVAYSLGRRSEHKKEAAELIKFLTEIEAQEILIDTGLGLPTRNSLTSKFIEKYPERKALIEMSNYGRAYNFGINGKKVSEELGKAIEELYIDTLFNKGDLDIKETLEKHAKNLE